MTKVMKTAIIVLLGLTLPGAIWAQSSDAEPEFRKVIADEAKQTIEQEKAIAREQARKEAARKAAARKAANRKAAAQKKAAQRRAAAAKRRAAAAAPKIAPLSVAEKSTALEKIASCYRAPSVLRRNRDDSVQILVKLSKEGYLTSSPLLLRGPSDLTISEEAYRVMRAALFSCQPIPMPADKYPSWAETVLELKERTVRIK